MRYYAVISAVSRSVVPCRKPGLQKQGVFNGMIQDSGIFNKNVTAYVIFI